MLWCFWSIVLLGQFWWYVVRGCLWWLCNIRLLRWTICWSWRLCLLISRFLLRLRSEGRCVIFWRRIFLRIRWLGWRLVDRLLYLIILRGRLWQWIRRLLWSNRFLRFWWIIFFGSVKHRFFRCALFWERFWCPWERFWCLWGLFLRPNVSCWTLLFLWRWRGCLLFIFYLFGLLVCLLRSILRSWWGSWSWCMNHMNWWPTIRLVYQYRELVMWKWHVFHCRWLSTLTASTTTRKVTGKFLE